MNIDLKNNPMLKDISQEKLDALSDIIKKSEGKSNKELIFHLMNASAAAGQDGLNFSNAETQLILNALKFNMNPEEKKKVDTIYQMARILSKKQANS